MRQRFFTSKSVPENLDPSNKMDFDFQDFLEVKHPYYLKIV